MLLTREKIRSFATKPIPDTLKTTGVLVALAIGSKQAVDEMVVKASGKKPKADYGFMVQRMIEDPDGHTWGQFWMDPNHVQKG